MLPPGMYKLQKPAGSRLAGRTCSAALLVVLSCVSPRAVCGVINGIVLEHSSGRPAGRARVKLENFIAGKLQTVSTVIANRSGQFVFLSVPDGLYAISTTRIGYATAMYGQKVPGGSGFLIPISADSNLFAELQLYKLGAITGKIVDENRVALIGVPVLAYPAELPLRPAVMTKSDDRGIYRLAGLDPGRYWVRTGPHDLEDGSGLLPTFFPESTGTKDATTLRVQLERDVSEVDIQPALGSLLRVSGRVMCSLPIPIHVTLTSDTGRKQATVRCMTDFSFDKLAPGYYELLAGDGSPLAAAIPKPFLSGPPFAHIDFFLDRNREGDNLQLAPSGLATFQVEVQGGGSLRPNEAGVVLRRKELDGEGNSIRVTSDYMHLAPGFWELAAAPPAGYYVVSITPQFDHKRLSRAGPSPEWYEVYLSRFDRNRITILLSPRPAVLSGTVTSSGRDPVPGAPVFLYPKEEARRRLNGFRTTRTDRRGGYRLDGLPPGSYWILSSFDLDEISEESLAAARAKNISLEEGRASVEDLTLHTIQ